MIRSLFAFALAGLLLPMSAAAAAPLQRTISFPVEGRKVVGTLELPDAVGARPVILLLPGFTGTRDEMMTPSVREGVFARAAHAWAAKGFASLRIDFRGNGDSEGKFEDMTISGQVQDALAAVDFLQGETVVDASRLSVVGWSLGGAVAATLAGRSRHPIKSVALWNAFSNPVVAFNTLLGADYIKLGLASGGRAVATNAPWAGEVSLKTGFFEDLYAIDPIAELARYSGPIFVAVGTLDSVVTPQPRMGQIFLTYHKGPGELWSRPMDHGFNALTDAETVDQLIAATGAFLQKYGE